MSLQTKVIGRQPTDHGPYDPNLAYGKKFQCTLFGCAWESLHDNNNTAPAVWDGGDTITLNTVDWKKVSGSYEAWLMNHDKPAASEQYPFNGMGRVRLQKNIVNGVNTLTQAMLTQQNTVYVIQYDFTLGEDITIPANCVLEFDGGSISNGTLTGNNTIINDAENIFDNIVISGTWIAPIIRASMFKQSSNILKQIQSLMNSNIHNDVFIDKDCVAIFPQIYNGTAFNICRNSDVYITKTITANNLVNSVSLINAGEDNITITGGTLIGPKDIATSEQSSWEWEHGITIGGKNVSVKNVTINKFMGDGIYISSSNVTIEGCDISYVNRNGISITDNSPYNINLIGNYIHDISGGVLNMSVDFEPNSGSISNCSIKNNVTEHIQLISSKNILIENNTCGSLIVTNSEYITIIGNSLYRLTINSDSNQVNVENNKLRGINIGGPKNVVLDNNLIDAAENLDICGDVNIKNCSFKNSVVLYINKAPIDNNIIFNNNTFEKFYVDKRSNYTLTINDVIRFYNNTFNCGGETIHVGSSPYLIFENNTFNVSNLDAYLITPSDGGLSLYKNNLFIFDSSITVGRICGIANDTVIFIDNILVTNIRAITCYAKLAYVRYISSITDIDIPNRVAGPSTGRPSGIYRGTVYFDETLNKPIWWNGTAWVDATGTPV